MIAPIIHKSTGSNQDCRRGCAQGSTVFGGLHLSKGTEFTIGLAFDTTQHALRTLMQSLSVPFKETPKSFVRQWDRTSRRSFSCALNKCLCCVAQVFVPTINDR